MGGLVALILARDHADVVDRLMVVDVPAFFSVLINLFATARRDGGVWPSIRAAPTSTSRSRSWRTNSIAPAEKLVTDPDSVERIVHWGMTSDRGTIGGRDGRGDGDGPARRHAEDRSAGGRDLRLGQGWRTSKMGIDQIYASSYAGLVQRPEA